VGLSPIITNSSLKHAEFLKSLGATHVLDRKLPAASLRSEIKRIANAPIEYVYDAISSEETQEFGYNLLASGGSLGVVLGVKVTKADDKTAFYIMGYRNRPENREILESLYSKLARYLEEGIIVVCFLHHSEYITPADGNFYQPNRYEILPGGLGAVAEGLRRLQNNEVSGVKLVVHPDRA
jgi:NADPH:quinone reductase-like Zn-dependent oxidoreductase